MSRRLAFRARNSLEWVLERVDVSHDLLVTLTGLADGTGLDFDLFSEPIVGWVFARTPDRGFWNPRLGFLTFDLVDGVAVGAVKGLSPCCRCLIRRNVDRERGLVECNDEDLHGFVLTSICWFFHGWTLITHK